MRWLADNQAVWEEYWAPDPEAPDVSVSVYLTRMARDGEWGDHHTLQAICWEFGVHIKVMKMMAGGMGFLLVGDPGPNVRVILLSLEHNHYENCIKG